ncbi:SCO family protein [Pontibacter populi]|uniref:SCO family protein n=1 Tax=Pontibacter populi TaxID=890055 RepID=A0ABV1RRI9_9BACT
MKYLLPLSILLGLTLSSCSETNTTDALAAHQSAQATIAGNTELSEMSLYNLESEWQNEDDETVKLVQLNGKVQLVAMMYTNCTYACPRIVADLKRIEAKLDNYKKEDVGIVLVTMDPENDTPEKLQQFATDNNLDPDRWTLLTSDEMNIQELAVLLNMKYKNGGKGEIAHSNIITVLNAGGEIIHQQEGLGKDPDETVKTIDGLLRSI